MRAAVNAAFALWLFTRHPAWFDFFAAASLYALGDGALGLCAGLLLSAHVLVEAPSLLTATTLVDGMLRVAAGVALRLLPGIPDFPVSAVAFYGVLGASSGCLAMLAVYTRFAAARRARAMGVAAARLHELFDPLDVAGLLAFALAAYAFFFGPPVRVDQLRAIGIAWGTAFAVALAISAFGVTPRR